MIRINLLPRSRDVRVAAPSSGGSSAPWLVAYLVAFLVWVACLFGIYLSYASQLEEKLSSNKLIEDRIAQSKIKSQGIDEVEAKLAASRQLEELVNELNARRVGPTRVLMEVSKILSPNGGPTIDPRALEALYRENPNFRSNRNWDTRRLWLHTFTEQSRACRITGQSKTNDDIAEFLKRLAISEVFTDVTLERTQAVEQSGSSLVFIDFEITCRVEY